MKYLILSSWFVVISLGSSAAAAQRPNVIIILADDMGYSDFRCFGGEISTPNLDQLASHGIRFTQFCNAERDDEATRMAIYAATVVAHPMSRRTGITLGNCSMLQPTAPNSLMSARSIPKLPVDCKSNGRTGMPRFPKSDSPKAAATPNAGDWIIPRIPISKARSLVIK